MRRDGDLKVTVKHPDEDGCDIRAFVRDDRITIFLGDVHEDFTSSDDDDRDLVDEAVEWFLDALRGRIEFTTYRGGGLVSTRYVRHADDGTQHASSGFLTPARLRLWQPKRRVQRRPSWT